LHGACSTHAEFTVWHYLYVWQEETCATWYYLWVNDPSGAVIQQWYEASVICSAGTCTATPDTSLTEGDHTWWIRPWSDGTGDGPWSNSVDFTFTCVALDAPTGISPSGNSGDLTPTFSWQEKEGATWYYLWVNGPSGNVFKTWYRSSDICSGGTCAVTYESPLSFGDHTWWVHAWSDCFGDGPWSAAIEFTVICAQLNATTLVSPSETIGDATPTYTWQEEDGATYYQLWVNGPAGNVIQEWYTAAETCSGDTCSVTPDITLDTGNHIWWIRGWSECDAHGPWSDSMEFTMTGGS
jgi:hypothetical protein